MGYCCGWVTLKGCLKIWGDLRAHAQVTPYLKTTGQSIYPPKFTPKPRKHNVIFRQTHFFYPSLKTHYQELTPILKNYFHFNLWNFNKIPSMY